jgi:hypothetical protein
LAFIGSHLSWIHPPLFPLFASVSLFRSLTIIDRGC